MIRELDELFPKLVHFYGAKLFSVPLSLLYLSLVAKTLGPAGYGELAVVLGLGQFLYYGAAAWSEPALLRFGREELERHGTLQRTVGTRTALAAGCFLAVTAALVAVRPQVLHLTNLTPAALAAAIIWGLAYIASNAALYVLRIAGRLRESATASVWRNGSSLVLLWLLVRGRIAASPLRIVAVEVVASGCTLLYAGWWLRGQRVWPLRWDPALGRRLAAYCFPVVFSYISGYFSDWGHLFIINRHFTTDAVGLYAAVGRVLGHTQLMLMSLYTLLVPVLVSIRTQGRDDLQGRYIRDGLAQASWAWTFALVGLWAAAQPVLARTLGPAYAGHEMLYSVLLAGFGFQLVTVLGACQFLAADVVYVPVRINVLAEFGVQLAVIFAVVYSVGTLEAVAWAICLARAASALLAWTWLGRLFHRPSLHALAFPAVLVGLAVVGAVTGPARVTIAAAAAIGLLVWARAARLIKPQDLAWCERMQVPLVLRKRLAFLAG